MDLSIWALVFLWFFVFLAGFVDSAAGGGGLISLPAYLFVGLPPHTAIGCNKFSAACGTTLSAARFFKNGAVDWQVAAISAVCSFVASYLGIRIALMINQETLKTVLVIVLPIVAVLLLLKRNFGAENQSADIPKKKAFILAACAGLVIGFYDGLIGPGTGTIAIIVFSAWMKYDLKTASGNAKVLNLACRRIRYYRKLYRGGVCNKKRHCVYQAADDLRHRAAVRKTLLRCFRIAAVFVIADEHEIFTLRPL